MGIWKDTIRFSRKIGFNSRLKPKKIDPVLTSKVFLIVVPEFLKNSMINKKGRKDDKKKIIISKVISKFKINITNTMTIGMIPAK